MSTLAWQPLSNTRNAIGVRSVLPWRGANAVELPLLPHLELFDVVEMDSTTNSELNDSSNPISPNSVLQEQPAANSPVKGIPDIHVEPPLLRPLRLRAIGKLQHLSFHFFPVVLDPSTALTQSENEVDELELDSLDACMILQPVSLSEIGDDLGYGSKGFEDDSFLSTPSNSSPPIAKARETPSKSPANDTEKKTNEADGSSTDTKSSKLVSPTFANITIESATFIAYPYVAFLAYGFSWNTSVLGVTKVFHNGGRTNCICCDYRSNQEPKTPRPPALSGVFSTPSLLSKSDSPSSPPWPSQSCVAPSSPCPPPPPPSPVASSGQQSSLTSSNGFAPPPPPPLAATKAIRAKRNDARLKRSTPMGKLYRALKGKVEGSSLDGKALQVRKNQVGNSSGGNKAQGMADALAEMTKRSSYFRQIEEDVEKHSASILKMISSLNSFKTKDMKELSKFHQKIEQVLEKLTDETQVLSRFEGFPLKKLETIQVAAALHMRLESIVAALKGWKLASPIAQQLAKVECYFNKIKEEVDVTERNKDEESKRLKNHNIMFDFTALVRIKEAMVDLSSDCMEMVLKECRETQEIAGETTSKSKTRLKMLWRAFQLAFRVYNFAGGQDDRADKLTRELAREIEACSES
ncbi:hypothetical protein ZIOFF_075225 [Zingiber officinale]|uniref:Hydroxyproline-rich glycoprotein family protein n=1 Tax=Zingiber officinale TaxID=94328 RepID=A0A8J5BV85_ZINOF|nr:hypothetical protein ZIOFF_075225 [Zingiber officinale]